jgi:S1-C subfamily serine protease
MGQSVFTVGFPNLSIQGVEPKFTDGRISSLSGVRDDQDSVQISVPIQPGNSGGALGRSEIRRGGRGGVLPVILAGGAECQLRDQGQRAASAF